MTYNRAAVSATLPKAKPTVEVFGVTDSRKNSSTRIGAIRGGFGNPIKTLEASAPVKDVVRQAFLDGLSARGLLAAPGAGSYGIELTVKRLDSSQLVRREAHSDFVFSVIEKTSGRQIYSKDVADNRADEGSLAGGILGSVEELRKITNDSLQAAVDQALDNPAFLSVIGVR
ncbi:YajG family lipoprotein [Azospirillum thermophilum]|uniref:YajG family lipoprotein n=1 Tax=Azospirillum thermophilum TaxID=2202148 RepID=UPI00143D18B6|nr:YajG family lipoprotein [Azospirillum thermophilum]